MILKKNDRVVYKGEKTGTVASDLGSYDPINKESWIDVIFDNEKYICQIKKEHLVKIDNEKVAGKEMFKSVVKEIVENNFSIPQQQEKGFDLEKLHKLDIYENIKPSIMLNKMIEEVKEVRQALINNDPINLAEELLDVMQTCIGVAAAKGIDLGDHIEDHNKKLLNRKHKFI